MSKLEKLNDSEHTHLMRILFGHTPPTPPTAIDSFDYFDSNLNESQKEAVRFALASPDIALIHGPPGTGKTYTLIELIRQLLRLNRRILVCGPSNVSVDNIVERLAPLKVPIVRVGHPARLLPSVLDHSLEVLTHTSDAGSIVKDVRREIDQKQASIRKTRNGRERRQVYGDIKELRKEFREREAKCVDSLVRGSQVVLATLHGAGGYQLRNSRFDVVIIDEASQALEAQCWVPLLKAEKVVLAGDHLQLPPTIKSVDALRKQQEKNGKKEKKGKKEQKDSESGESKEENSTQSKGQGAEADNFGPTTLETTLFDRLLFLYGPSIKRMLTTQYRMHEKIMTFPSDALYEGKLIAGEAVRARLLKDLPYDITDTDDTHEPLVFYDTQGGDFAERGDDETDLKTGLLAESKSNEMEACIVERHVEDLISTGGVDARDIAVITPYNAQLALLSRALKTKYPTLELGSVDGFQGREKEAVVVSLVRSNDKGEVGFLGEKRRLNGEMLLYVSYCTDIGLHQH